MVTGQAQRNWLHFAVAMRKVLGVLFLLMSAVIGTTVLLVWGIRTSLLTSETWKASFREARVYDRVLVEALPEIVSGESVTGSVLEDAPLTPNDLVAVVQSTVTADFLQQQVEHGFDAAFALVHGRATLATTSFVIPLQDIKRKLPIAVQEKLAERLQALPICTAEQLRDFEKFKTLNGALPPCRPKGLDVQAIVRDSLKIEEITANIPATFDVVAELQKQRSSDEQTSTGSTKQDGTLQQGTIQQKDEGVAKFAGQEPSVESKKTIAEQVADVQAKVQLGFRLHLYLTLEWIVILLGAGALFIPHWRRVVQWFAVGLFIPSALLIVGTLVGRGEFPDHFTTSDRTAQIMANIGHPVAASLIHTASLRLLIIGSTGVALAIILFTLAYSFARRRIA